MRDEFDYPLYVGKEFWHHLTGDENFYDDLRLAIAEVANEANGSTTLANTITKLAASNEIKQLSK